MKKIYILLFILISFSFYTANSFYTSDSNLEKQFIKSPSLNEIKLIEDKIQKACEIIFLKAYMRRSFTNNENKYCSDIFERKIEAEMIYKNRVLWERGIFY